MGKEEKNKSNDDNLFRKKALNEIASPEKLDNLINIITPKYWITLIAFFILTTFFILWSFFGNIPQRVHGSSLLIKPGGLVNVTASEDGRLLELYVREGDSVKKGDVIAKVEQQEIFNEIELLKSLKEDLKVKNTRIQAVQDEIRKGLQMIAKELDVVLKAEKNLLKSGIISLPKAIATEQKLKDTLNSIRMLELANLEAQEQLSKTERKLSILLGRYEYATKVVSLHNGIVTEVKAGPGDNITEIMPIVSIEPVMDKDEKIRVIVFVPGVFGKKIKPDMRALIMPGTVSKEEYGALEGKVTNVSIYPASVPAMMKILRNKTLVDELLHKGVAYEVEVSLLEDPNTVSGYKWTSVDGPPLKLQSGTLGEAEITLKRRKPITLLLPYIKKVTGFD